MSIVGLNVGVTVTTVTAAAGLLARGVLTPSSTLLAPSIHAGPAARYAIALTFVDGPSKSTPDLLILLQRYGIRVTLFQCGASVRRLPQAAREVVSLGHELGNHTDTHPRLCFKSAIFIYNQLLRGQETIVAATGVLPKLFRPPYGLRWFELRSAQKRSV
jgi:peptidoglycan/xylan/chitin deacetylase (PgdA/CDA1 family)